MAIERLVHEAIQIAATEHDRTQLLLTLRLSHTLKELKKQGFRDLPSPDSESVTALPGEELISVVDTVLTRARLESDALWNLPDSETLESAQLCLLEFLASRRLDNPDEVITLEEMGCRMRRYGLMGTKDTVRQHLYAIRRLMRQDPSKRFTLVNVHRIGYQVKDTQK